MRAAQDCQAQPHQLRGESGGRGKLEIINNIPMTHSELHDGIELCVSYTQHQGLESLFGW